MVAALLTHQEFNLLWEKYQEDKDIEIRNKIVESNIRLVFYVVKQEVDKKERDRWGDDVIASEGMPALVESVEKFDPARGFQFNTYAYTAIRRRIKAWITKQRGSNGYTKTRALMFNNAVQELGHTLDGPPTLEDISDHLAVSLKEVKKLKRAADAYNRVTYHSGDTYSLEVSQGVTEANFPHRDTCPYDFNELLEGLVDTRERQVISSYYFKGMTFREIGDSMGVTREYVRQIRNEALENLRDFLEKEGKKVSR